MPRDDLLALTDDDLITLTNRGVVRRAVREMEAGELTCEFEEQGDGTLIVRWSDGIVCRFPAGGSLEDALCSSGSTGISRHVVRSVLAMRRCSPGQSEGEESQEKPGIDLAWDPGKITDEQLEQRFRKAAITRARRRFDEGILVELVRSHKPLARFLHEPCTVRFLVPGDLRYVYADCAENLQSLYVPLAVWAFRELPEEQPAGLVSVQREAAVVPHELLDDIDRTISELCRQGVASSGGPWRDRTTRLLDRCRQAGLIWPAELITDVLHAIERYQEHDARFDPAEVVQWLGELAIRSAAIRHDTGAVPQLLIRGSASDTPTEIRSARFIGLGCGVHCGPGSVRLTAFHQNVDSGNVVAIHRDFADPPADSDDEPRDFHLLARTTVSRGVSFAALAAGQMLLKSGRRTPGHRLTLPRGHFGVNPQSFHWEKLRAPVLAEGVAEIASRLETLPPSSLRPRRIAEDLHVCPLQQVESIEFDAAAQRLVARARDPRGDALTIVHPYNTRGQQGFESLAATLERHGADIRFVAGHVRQGSYGFEMHPLCVVFEVSGSRIAVHPWIDQWDGPLADFADGRGEASISPADQIHRELVRLLSDLCVIGLRGLRGEAAAAWRELAQQAGAVGFVQLTAAIGQFAESIARRAEVSRWDVNEATARTTDLLVLSRMIQDLQGAAPS